MRIVEHDIEMGVFEKDWGREVYIETLEDTTKYLNAKGLDFIADKVKSEMEGVSSYKELCISENKNGFVLAVGRCGFGSFSYRELYNSEL
ncbi:hypothetical protein P9265_07580 [Schinkia azotoformans]|uniref:hypothetical protein n=1 Tax=Schinkia azotoformans TaxID=1454 RepID=UPI002E236F0E|nr:hypothetical protein [Schinkia azotoformans]